jgi:DNA-binding transcriptional MerR regulator
MRRMRIGELARRAGVHVQTIRFYERERLLRKPPRSAAGYRLYEGQDLEVVQTIRKAQRFGFTLQEIRRMLRLYALPDEKTGRTPYARGSSACLDEILGMAVEKLKALDEKIGSLSQTRAELAGVVRQVTRSRRERLRAGPRSAVSGKS